MSFKSVGINLFGGHLAGEHALAEDLRYLGSGRTGGRGLTTPRSVSAWTSATPPLRPASSTSTTWRSAPPSPPRPPHPPPRQPGPPRARRRRARQDGSSRFPRRPGCSGRGAAAGGRGPEAGDPHGPGRAGKGRKAVLLGEHRPRSPCSVRCLIPDRPAACSVG